MRPEGLRESTWQRHKNKRSSDKPNMFAAIRIAMSVRVCHHALYNLPNDIATTFTWAFLLKLLCVNRWLFFATYIQTYKHTYIHTNLLTYIHTCIHTDSCQKTRARTRPIGRPIADAIAARLTSSKHTPIQRTLGPKRFEQAEAKHLPTTSSHTGLTKWSSKSTRHMQLDNLPHSSSCGAGST